MLEFKDAAGYVWYFNHLISFIMLIVTFTWACKQQYNGNKDKLAHYLVSAILTVLLIYIFNHLHVSWWSWWYSPIVVISIGIGKEVYDYFNPKKHKCDFMDFVFDFMGVATVTVVYLCSWILYKEI